MEIKVNATTNKGYTPLFLANACGALECAAMLRAAGGGETMEPPIRGFRSILDIPLDVPAAMPFTTRAADDKGRNLQRPTYFGQY